MAATWRRRGGDFGGSFQTWSPPYLRGGPLRVSWAWVATFGLDWIFKIFKTGLQDWTFGLQDWTFGIQDLTFWIFWSLRVDHEAFFG